MGTQTVTLLDTNLLIRWITEDDPRKADRVGKRFQKASQEKEKLLLSDLGIAEFVFVLEKFYNMKRAEIASALRAILATKGLVLEHRERIVMTLGVYELHSVSFVDAYHHAMAREQSEARIYSYDYDFDKLEGITRLEP